MQHAPFTYQTQYAPIPQAPQPGLGQKGLMVQAIPAGPVLQANAIPLGLLGRFPATVFCPVCGQVSQTGTKYEVGKGTQ